MMKPRMKPTWWDVVRVYASVYGRGAVEMVVDDFKATIRTVNAMWHRSKMDTFIWLWISAWLASLFIRINDGWLQGFCLFVIWAIITQWPVSYYKHGRAGGIHALKQERSKL